MFTTAPGMFTPDTQPLAVYLGDFAPDASGTNKSTTAFLNAIAAANKTGMPMKIVVGRGTFLVDPLNIGGGFPGALIIEGCGWDTHIKLTSGANGYIFFCNNVYTPGLVIRDMYLDCNGANQSSAGGAIDTNGTVLSRFDHLYIDTPWNDGILMRNDGTGNPGHHNTIHDCWFVNGKNSGGNGYGLNITNADECRVIGCTFQDNGNGSIGEPHQVFDQFGDNYFAGNTFLNGGAGVNGISCQGLRSELIGNTFDGGTGNQARVTRDLVKFVANDFLNIGSGKSGIYITPGGVAGCVVQANTFRPINGVTADSAIKLDTAATNNQILFNDMRLDHTTGTWSRAINVGSALYNDIRGNIGWNIDQPQYWIEYFGANPNNTAAQNNAAIQNCLTAAGGQPVYAGPGNFHYSLALLVNAQGAGIIGAGKDITIFTCDVSSVDGIQVGNTQVTPFTQLNYIQLRDFSVQVPGNSTKSAINVTGMGYGGAIKRVKVGQGAIGFLLEDIDRCVFEELETDNTTGQGIVCRQGIVNTWGTATFVNCVSVLNTANTVCLQFDADSDQASPNKLDRISFIGCHFYANPGLAGTVGFKALIGATATTFLDCLYENPLRYNDIEAEVDAAWFGCTMLNVNYGTTPTDNGWYLNSFCAISIYDCFLQQMTNLFNGVSGFPRVYLGGLNKINNATVPNIFVGSFGVKLGTDVISAGDQALSTGLNNQQMSNVFTQNLILSKASAFTSGSGAPNNANGANGDYYFRQDTPGTANQRIYVKSAGAWVGVV